jgi:hypothetical protein
MNQHQLDTVFLVCLLGVSASTCFGSYSLIFRMLCKFAIWCNCVRRNRNQHAVHTHPTYAITPNSKFTEPPENERVTPEKCRGIDS